MLGITSTFTRPDDFVGKVVGTLEATLEGGTVEALGATSRGVPPSPTLEEFDWDAQPAARQQIA